MGVVYLDTNLGELERIALELAATKAQVAAAARRAVSKLARWIKSVSLREASRDTGIQRKVLKNRLFMGVRGTQYTARVWYGLNAVPLSALNPKQTASGVVAGPVNRRHAFIVESGGRRQVYRRVRRDRRLPIAVQHQAVKDEFERVLRVDVNPRFREMFSKYFEQELRWETTREVKA